VIGDVVDTFHQRCHALPSAISTKWCITLVVPLVLGFLIVRHGRWRDRQGQQYRGISPARSAWSDARRPLRRYWAMIPTFCRTRVQSRAISGGDIAHVVPGGVCIRFGRTQRARLNQSSRGGVGDQKLEDSSLFSVE
jgi:hypothetical protein